MLRNFFVLALIAASFCFSSVSHGDVFYSGRFDVNGGSYGGENGVGVNRLTPIGGRSFTNAVTTGGFPVEGNTVNAVGIATFTDWNVGAGSTGSVDQNQRVVAVYSLQGSFVAGSSTDLIANFNGGQGIVRFYDRATLTNPTGTGLVLDDPQTWFPNFSDMNEGLIASFTLADRPTGLQQGAPGGSATDNLTGFTTGTINIASAVAGSTSAADGAAAVLLDFLGDNGVLFDYLAAYLEDPSNPQLLVTLSEQILAADESDIENGTGIADLSAIFAAFLNDALFVPDGDTYDPSQLGLNNGDVVQNIIGGRSIPGSSVAEVPEPASMIIWGSLAAAGAVAYRRRRKFNA